MTGTYLKIAAGSKRLKSLRTVSRAVIGFRLSAFTLCLALALALAPAALALAGPEVVEIEGVPQLNPQLDIPMNLDMFKDKKIPVTLMLEGGNSVTGLVKSVEMNRVVLTKVEGREFFDAYIPADRIIMIQVKARDFKR